MRSLSIAAGLLAFACCLALISTKGASGARLSSDPARSAPAGPAGVFSAPAGPAGVLPPYEDAVYFDAPLAYWRLGESRGATTAIDASGNGHPATYRGVTLGEPGALHDDPDTAARFSGSDALDAGDVFDFADRKAFTLEAWAFLRSVENNHWHRIVSKEAADAQGRQGYTFWINRDPTLGMIAIAAERFRDGGADSVSYAIPENEFHLRRWYHLAVTYVHDDVTQNGTLSLYVNGVRVRQSSGANRLMKDTTTPFFVGQTPAGGGFPGKLDDVAVYGRALTSAEVRSHYTANPVYPSAILDDAPAGHWRLGEQSGVRTARDASGNGVDGTYSGVKLGKPGAIFHDPDTSGYFGGSASVDIGDRFDFPGVAPFTLEAWIEPAQIDESGWHMIFRKEAVEGQGRQGYTFWLNRERNPDLIVLAAERFRDGVADAVRYEVPEVDFNLDRWYHVALTYNGTDLVLYFEGDEVARAASSRSLRDTAASLRIGSTFIGRLDEPAVFPRALGPNEIRNDFAGNAPPSYRRSVERDEPRGWWRLGDPVKGIDATLAYDASGNELNGVYGADVSRGAAGALRADDDTAAQFAGADPGPGDEVVVGDSSLFDFGNDFSVEAWLKVSLTNDRRERAVVAKYNDEDGPYERGWVLSVTDDPGYEGRVKAVLDDGVSSTTAYGPALSVNDGDWHHVALVVDRCNEMTVCPDNVMLLYVDRVGSITPVPPPRSVSNDEPFTIGDTDGYDPFDGTLDEVAVYAYALPADRVRAHYDAAVGLPSPYATEVEGAEPIAAWRLSEAAGSTIAEDETEEDLNGTYGNAVTPGVHGALMDDIDTAAHFPGTDVSGAVNVPDDPSLDVAGADFTVEAWVSTTRNEERLIVGKGAGGESIPNWFITVSDDAGHVGTARAQIYDGTAPTLVAYGPPIRIDDGRWHHIAFAFDRDKGIFAYVDGVEKFTAGVRQGDVSNKFDLQIGDIENYAPFNGHIDEVALYFSLPAPAQIAARAYAGTVPRFGAAYFRGDAITTPGVVRIGAQQYEWRLANRHGGLPAHVFSWQQAGTPVAGDWDGDGTDTPGVVLGNHWLLSDGYGGSPDYEFDFGLVGDVPVVGDWDGDGIDTPGVQRGNQWSLSSDFVGTIYCTFGFGLPQDEAITGDWNGNGKDAVGVHRTDSWYLATDDCSGTELANYRFGGLTDEGVAGDWDDDGTDTIGVRRGTVWILSDDFVSEDYFFRYGSAADTAVVGDWDPEPLESWAGWEEPDSDEAPPQSFPVNSASIEASALTAVPVDNYGSTIRDYVVRYAPRVYIHPDDDDRPARPLNVFIEQSRLYWHGISDRDFLYGQGNVNPRKLGIHVPLRRRYYRRTSRTWYGYTLRFVATDCTRPTAGTCSRKERWNRTAESAHYFYSPLLDDDGFFLDLISNNARRGEQNLQRAPVFYSTRATRSDFQIAYWMFYAYNRGPFGAGNHEGDWEHIVLRFVKGILQNVAFYRHTCYEPVSWEDVEFVPNTDHPIAYAAKGSHGLYPHEGDFLGCGLFPDKTRSGDEDNQWNTWDAPLLRAGRQPWYGFGGAWGQIEDPHDRTALPGPLGLSKHKGTWPSCWEDCDFLVPKRPRNGRTVSSREVCVDEYSNPRSRTQCLSEQSPRPRRR